MGATQINASSSMKLASEGADGEGDAVDITAKVMAVDRNSRPDGAKYDTNDRDKTNEDDLEDSDQRSDLSDEGYVPKTEIPLGKRDSSWHREFANLESEDEGRTGAMDMTQLYEGIKLKIRKQKHAEYNLQTN